MQKICSNMQVICILYAYICMNMHAYHQCIKYETNMHKICKKVCFPYAIHMLNICSNMQEYDKNMHKYAIAKYAQICMNMQNMHKTCTDMHQYARHRYMAKQAKICKL